MKTKKILVLDDDPDLLEIMNFILCENGYDTGDSDEPDHPIPAQADHQFRGKLTRGFRWKLTTLNV